MPTQDVPRSPSPGSAPLATKPNPRAALGGWALADGGLPPRLGCFWPPSSSSRGSQGGTVRRGSRAWGRTRGTNQVGGKALPAQWLLARSPQELGQPRADRRVGKGVRLQVWAPPEGDPTGALPLGSSLGRRERSCHALGEPNTVLVSGKWSTTSSEAQAGRGEGTALI